MRRRLYFYVNLWIILKNSQTMICFCTSHSCIDKQTQSIAKHGNSNFRGKHDNAHLYSQPFIKLSQSLNFS